MRRQAARGENESEAEQGGGPDHGPKIRARALIGWQLFVRRWRASKTLVGQVPSEAINSMMTTAAGLQSGAVCSISAGGREQCIVAVVQVAECSVVVQSAVCTSSAECSVQWCTS